MQPTTEEAKWIERLRRVCQDMPSTCWLFAATCLEVMRRGEHGETVMRPQPYGGVDPAYILDSIDVDINGGDW